MKLARCAFDGGIWWGAVEDDEVRLLSNADGVPFETLVSRGLDALRRSAPATGLADVQLLSPIPAPSKVICVGLNYRDHAIEAGMAIPDAPLLFAKFPSSVVGPGTPVVIPSASDQIDWEVELAIVISGPARHVPSSRALDVVAGYTIANDVSARDLQIADGQFVRAKSYDTFCPVGPWIVTIDELGAANDLEIGLSVNGETMQRSRTSQMVFDVADIVSYCSAVATLYPGDLILTGTPHGTGFGLDPKRYLQPGDEMKAWIEGIGALESPVVASRVGI